LSSAPVVAGWVLLLGLSPYPSSSGLICAYIDTHMWICIQHLSICHSAAAAAAAAFQQ
jgi:hypothetical protein